MAWWHSITCKKMGVGQLWRRVCFYCGLINKFSDGVLRRGWGWVWDKKGDSGLKWGGEGGGVCLVGRWSHGHHHVLSIALPISRFPPISPLPTSPPSLRVPHAHITIGLCFPRYMSASISIPLYYNLGLCKSSPRLFTRPFLGLWFQLIYYYPIILKPPSFYILHI